MRVGHFQRSFVDPGDSAILLLYPDPKKTLMRTSLISSLAFGNSWCEGWKRNNIDPRPFSSPISCNHYCLIVFSILGVIVCFPHPPARSWFTSCLFPSLAWFYPPHRVFLCQFLPLLSTVIFFHTCSVYFTHPPACSWSSSSLFPSWTQIYTLYSLLCVHL